MSFAIFNTSRQNRQNLKKIEPIPEYLTLQSDIRSISFPISTLTTLESTKNFKLSYTDNTSNETRVFNDDDISFDSGDGKPYNKGKHTNNNYALVKAYQTCFDISAHFSIKIPTTDVKSDMLEFNYTPDISALYLFMSSVGSVEYKFCGGNINSIIYNYNTGTWPNLTLNNDLKVVNSSLKKSEDPENSLQATGVIQLNNTIASSSTPPYILLSISLSMTFQLN